MEEEEDDEDDEVVVETRVEINLSMLWWSLKKGLLPEFSSPGQEVLAAKVMVRVSLMLRPGERAPPFAATAEDTAGQHTCAPGRLNRRAGQGSQEADDVAAGEELKVILGHKSQVELEKAPTMLLYLPGGQAMRTPSTQKCPASHCDVPVAVFPSLPPPVEYQPISTSRRTPVESHQLFELPHSAESTYRPSEASTTA